MTATTTSSPPLSQPPLGFSSQGNVVPPQPKRTPTETVRSKAWLHFVAGGVGGMMGAIVTSPLDVVKTRLQSEYYKNRLSKTRIQIPVIKHFVDTGQILCQIYRVEGCRAYFKGLGPNLVGVIPARAIHFFAYGNGKRIITELNGGVETALVHTSAAILAGITTSTITNPIWLIKTRMQLQSNNANSLFPVMKYRNSFDCVLRVIHEEGVRGLYKGLSASYLGTAESTMQWVIYESLKAKLAERRKRNQKVALDVNSMTRKGTNYWHCWLDNFIAAGTAKLLAACVTYPHEVIRTRLRQPPEPDGKLKYTGIIQCVRTVAREEGLVALYGGLSAHLMRVVPNAAIMFFCYEFILNYGSQRS
ncbi:5331_t:CDS:2 [Paraglomus brasilianum]|uniref:5331_t:CDS:1 n=1 Tax=Paraglomus brasilianum TaxID=144538 RepID=A0A9N9BA00_9GLOM|nr:5331_t:CDS:2 [Paraglomus brasilianum]